MPLELADLFVRLTGFGNAAGLLVNRGLFGMGGFAQAKTTRSDIEAMTGRPLGGSSSSSSSSGVVGAGASTSRQATSRGPTVTEEPDLTEEEEEEKARILMTQLEDMERRGLVKLVRKGDPQPGPDGTFPAPPKKDDDADAGAPHS